jgi:hypothetical protein
MKSVGRLSTVLQWLSCKTSCVILQSKRPTRQGLRSCNRRSWAGARQTAANSSPLQILGSSVATLRPWRSTSLGFQIAPLKERLAQRSMMSKPSPN